MMVSFEMRLMLKMIVRVGVVVAIDTFGNVDDHCA